MQTTDYLNSNLKSLIAKVHDEGIEKANTEAQQIIAEAKQHASDLLNEAEQRIAKMEEQSLSEVNRLRENLNSELKAVTQQTISTVKNELGDVISNRVISKGVDEALSEKEFLQKIIFVILQKWNPADADFQFELMLNKNGEEELREFFEQRIKKELATEIKIVIDNKVKSGFKIAVKNENYYVNFSGEAFENFFKGYLRKKTIEWIYGAKKNEDE